MKEIPSIEPYLKRHAEIDAMMAQPDFYADQRKAAALSREFQKIQGLLAMHERLSQIAKEISGNTQILSDPSTDPEMREMVTADLSALKTEQEKISDDILVAMLPPDESDSRNTVVEIRAGTGGDEASLFAGDLYRLYCRFADEQGWKSEMLGSSPSECGGFKEVSFLVTGENVFRALKYESGVHRVQRIPSTEANGRIHTSTATVAVLPEAQEVDIQINPNDLEISVCRASGPGGQGVNTTDSAVQVVHKPTGMMVTCADERSQLKNKAKALTILRSRLLQAKQDEEAAKYAAQRKSQIGTGDRSERIRTYNFPQSRLTDHRIGFTVHNLPDVMEGNIGELVGALQKADYEEQVQRLIKGDQNPIQPRLRQADE